MQLQRLGRSVVEISNVAAKVEDAAKVALDAKVQKLKQRAKESLQKLNSIKVRAGCALGVPEPLPHAQS
jgi:hypothetical protein